MEKRRKTTLAIQKVDFGEVDPDTKKIARRVVDYFSKIKKILVPTVLN